MKIYRTKSEQGSVLILALLSIVVFFVLATAFLLIAQQHLKMQAKESTRATAFYRAERGINAVINLLMRDGDHDFRTAGDKGSPNTVAYAFDFNNVNFQVEPLDETDNPISDVIGSSHVEEMFETKKDSIWIKVTGFYYPRDEYDSNKVSDPGSNVKYMENIIKRTVVVRLSKFPKDAFDYAFYTCGDINAVGNLEVSGPIWVGGTSTVSGKFDYDTETSTIANDTDEQDTCRNYLTNIQAWGESLCGDPDTIPIAEGNYKDGNKEGPIVLCCEGDLTITGNVTFLDTSGPVILIVKGNLTLGGNVTFQGLAMTFGDYLNPKVVASAGGANDNHGSIISLQDLKLHGGDQLSLAYKDYGDFGYGDRISTSKWRETWDKFYVERGGTTYTIEVTDVPVPVID